MLALVGDEERVAEFSKKELSRVNRAIEKYSKSLDGLKEMTKLPEAVFVFAREVYIYDHVTRRLSLVIQAPLDG